MSEQEIRVVRELCATVDLPHPFVLVGRGGTNVVGSGPGEYPYVIDAEGVVLRAGAVYAWCRNGCCDEIPRRWKSVDEAADFHASYIVEDDTVRLPGDEARAEIGPLRRHVGADPRTALEGIEPGDRPKP